MSEGHQPAPDDWPRGFGESSVWPLVAALGVAGVYLGAGAVVLGRGPQPLLPWFVAPALLLPGVALFLAGLFGWTYHGFVTNYWAREAGDGDRFRWGLVLFLGTEVATFGGGFGYYVWVRAGAWPPHHAPELMSSLVLANTALLVVSSVTLHVAEGALRNGNRRRFLGLLGATLALGAVFLAGQVLEYHEFVVGDGFTLGDGVLASAFFGLTGLHGLHVTMGAVLLGIVFVRALSGQYGPDRHVSVTAVSMYWHFVDAVWILLVVVLYAGAHVQ